MFETIVVATDGSPSAGRAVDMAAGLARQSASRLIVVTVISHIPVPPTLRHLAEIEHLVAPERGRDPNPLSAGVLDDAPDQRIQAVIAERVAARAEATARAAGVERVEVCVDDGDPAKRIIERVAEHAADVVVMGSRGFSDLKGLMLGSVSHKVCQFAQASCLTVK